MDSAAQLLHLQLLTQIASLKSKWVEILKFLTLLVVPQESTVPKMDSYKAPLHSLSILETHT